MKRLIGLALLATSLYAGPGINVEVEVFIPEWPSDPCPVDDNGDEING